VSSHVWLEGEVGSGRGYIARYLHGLGSNSSKTSFLICDPTRDFTWPEEGTALLPNLETLAFDQQRRLMQKLEILPRGVRCIVASSSSAKSNMGQQTTARGVLYTGCVRSAGTTTSRPYRRHYTPV
jgi:DNA-binding NtrC family response regulator